MKNAMLLIATISLGAPIALAQAPIDLAKQSKKAELVSAGGKGILQTPESSFYYPVTDTIYVSSMGEDDGNHGQKPRTGFISKLSPDGKVIQAHWVTQLNKPTGIRIYHNRRTASALTRQMRNDGEFLDKLYVAAGDEVLEIQIDGIRDGQITRRTTIPSLGPDKPRFLNDIDVSPAGEVYVSDTFNNEIWKIARNGLASRLLFSNELHSPNGILLYGDRLMVVSTDIHTNGVVDRTFATPAVKRGNLLAVDLSPQSGHRVTVVSKTPIGGLDGLEVDNEGRFLVADFGAGIISRVNLDGTVEKIYQAPNGFLPDMSFDHYGRRIFTPVMNEGVVRTIDYDLLGKKF